MRTHQYSSPCIHAWGNSYELRTTNYELERSDLTSLFTTTITQAEILYGIAILPEGKRKYELFQSATLMFVEDFVGRVLPFDAIRFS